MNDVIISERDFLQTSCHSRCQLTSLAAKCRSVAGPKAKSTKTTSKRVSLRTVPTFRLDLSSADI